MDISTVMRPTSKSASRRSKGMINHANQQKIKIEILAQSIAPIQDNDIDFNYVKTNKIKNTTIEK
jgi:hypothetical protein